MQPTQRARMMRVDRGTSISWLVLVCALPLVTGCDGCRSTTESPTEEEPLPADEFSSGPPTPYPADRAIVFDAIKPGHWFSVSQTVQANLSNRRGTLRGHVSMPIVGADGLATGRSIVSAMESARPVVLPKSQRRRFEYRLLAPPVKSSTQSTCMLHSRLEVEGQVGTVSGNSQPYSLLAPHEYFFVVLTDRPDRFARLRVADWVKPITVDFSSKQSEPNYRIVLPPNEGLLPLPETMLDWTAVAVVLWDDVAGEDLTPGQAKAIADWIHFGGRLIVNGASAAEALQRSALGTWLPIRPTGNLELPRERAKSFLETWSVKTDSTVEKQAALVADGTARIMVEGKVSEPAEALPGGGLVATRRVGRGQVIQTRFDLTSDWVASWGSHDSFWNGVLLGRPHRKLVQEDDSGFGGGQLHHEFVAGNSVAPLSMINSSVRLFSRDASMVKFEGRTEEASNPSAKQRKSVFRPHGFGDMGGWSDGSDVLVLAQSQLRDNAGIEIPDLSLVAKAIGVYLTLLIPINFLLFRLLNRPEYAWFAIPVLAFGGAVAVARVARLDIGFARSQTELSILELQSDYPRGHLTRMVAVYNSLTTPYQASFDDPDGVAAPIGLFSGTSNGPTTTFQTASGNGPVLSGFSVDSNRVGMLRCEQLVDLGGSLSLDDSSAKMKLVNGTTHDFEHGYVMRRLESGVMEIASFDSAVSGVPVLLNFSKVTKPEQILDRTTSDDAEDWDPFGMMRMIATQWYLRPGETRLVSVIPTSMPGFTLSPDAGQRTGQTVVVATLVHPALDAAQPDLHLISDFRDVRTEIKVDQDDDPGSEEPAEEADPPKKNQPNDLSQIEPLMEVEAPS